MARTKQTARKVTGGKAPRKQPSVQQVEDDDVKLERKHEYNYENESYGSNSAQNSEDEDDEDLNFLESIPSKSALPPAVPVSRASTFPEDNYIILDHKVLQVTDFKNNNNKYYSLELHEGSKGGNKYYRLYSHYGRSDDLISNPQSGRKECRYCNDLAHAKSSFQSILREKQSKRKGYIEISLFSASIGSEKARGNATSATRPGFPSSSSQQSNLPKEVQDLVQYLYSEATKTLTSSIAATITSRGIETPLGVLSGEQVEKGAAVLQEIRDAMKRSASEDHLEVLSGKFYSLIPHNLGGRSREVIKKAVIKTQDMLDQKEELIQLMRDMVAFSNDGVLFNSDVGSRYRSLNCSIDILRRNSSDFDQIQRLVLDSQVRSRDIVIENIYSVKRGAETDSFNERLHNQQLLFHGSKVSNYVGLLSRGLLLPKAIVSMGGTRTNFGWLGAGLYFGNAACTSAIYTTAGAKGTRFMLVCRVALGNCKKYYKITPDLERAPKGYHSVHGVRRKPGIESDFTEDEFVVYERNQQRQEFLVEFRTNTDTTTLLTEKDAVKRDVVSSDDEEEGSDDDKHKASFPEAVENWLSQESEKSDEYVEEEESSEQTSDPFLPVTNKMSQLDITSSLPASRTFPSLPIKATKTADYQYLSLDDMKQKEDHLRDLFANNRSAPEIQDPFVSLIDVYANRDEFKFQTETPEEEAIPKILLNPRRGTKLGDYSVNTYEEFVGNWKSFSGGQLDSLDWSNIFVAGGSVLGCMKGLTEEGFSKSDIDLFLVGIEDQQIANEKLKSIYQTCCKNGNNPKIIRTQYAVTIINQYPYRNIQIVLRLYKSPAEVLIGFDVDACCCGFDGERAYVLPRTQRAINKEYNLIDMSRRSLTYEVRLIKYSKRGFAVAVPGFDRTRVDYNLFSKKSKDVNGLAKLLWTEYKMLFKEKNNNVGYTAPRARKSRKSRSRVRARRSNVDTSADFDDDDDDNSKKPDYSDVAIPWGPTWYADQVIKLLAAKDKANYFSGDRSGKGVHRHIFVSGIEGVLEGKSTWCRICHEQKHKQVKGTAGSVTGPLTWLVENPGRQLLTGSFHPISDNKWMDGVYAEARDELVQGLSAAAFTGNAEAISTLLIRHSHTTKDLNQPDLEGRQPLVHSLINGNIECSFLLLNSGAQWEGFTDSAGFNALHYAVYSGNLQSVEAILDRGCSPDLASYAKITPLHLACYYGPSSLVELLILRGANTEAVDESAGRYPIHYTAAGNQIESMRILLRHNPHLGAVVAADNSTALQLAVSLGRKRYVEAYTELSNTSFKNVILDSEAPEESTFTLYTPEGYDLVYNLFYDVESTHLSVDNANECDRNGVSPSMVAAIKDNLEILKKLELLGANLFHRDKLGQTALHFACAHGSLECAKYLVSKGLSINDTTLLGITPLHVALYYFGKFASSDSYYPMLPYPAVRRKLFTLITWLKENYAICDSIFAYPLTWKSNQTSFNDGRRKVGGKAPRKTSAPATFSFELPAQPHPASMFEVDMERKQLQPLQSAFPSPKAVPDDLAIFGPQPGMSLIAAIDPPAPFGPQPGTSYQLGSNIASSDPSAFSSIAKILMLLSILHKGGQITDDEKMKLKEIALKEESPILGALECYEVDKDLFELADTLKVIIRN